MEFQVALKYLMQEAKRGSQGRLAHKREDTTQRHYLHVTQKHLREAVNLMPGVCHCVSLAHKGRMDDKTAEMAENAPDTKPSQG